MGKLIDLTGRRFGRGVVIERCGTKIRGIKSKVKTPLWKCLCDCGNEFYATSAELRSGDTRSCGCLSIDKTKERCSTHGDAHLGSPYNRLYRIWYGMKERCENPKEMSYCRYGGRGISVCDEWHNYLSFKEWSLNNGYSDELSIDRIDNNGNYSPENCRWASWDVQANNRSSCRYVIINGEKRTITEWCHYLGINYSTVFSRIDRFHWDPIDALTKPPRSQHRVRAIYPDGSIEEFDSVNDASEKLGIKPSGIRDVCSGHSKTYKKIKWEYIKENCLEESA